MFWLYSVGVGYGMLGGMVRRNVWCLWSNRHEGFGLIYRCKCCFSILKFRSNFAVISFVSLSYFGTC